MKEFLDFLMDFGKALTFCVLFILALRLIIHLTS
jgi:hypothetical protein